MMINEKFPLEKYIVAQLKKNECNVDLTTNLVFAKYPFFNKRELKDIVSKVLENLASKKTINGFWMKVGKEWELITKTKLKAIYLPEDNAAEANVGRGNRYNVAPKTNRNPDRYEAPKKEDELQQVYDRMKGKYKRELADLDDGKINKILLEELATLGYGAEDIKKLNMK